MRIALAVILISCCRPADSWAVYECGGEQDTCTCGGDNFCLCDGTCGNCVWHAWHMACCGWGRALEWCTDAGTWDEYADNNGYQMGSTPQNSSIFVCNPSTTCSQWGHVGWVVTAYPDGSFDSTEQFWGGPCGTHDRHREAGFATAGFIYDPDGSEVDGAEFVSETIPDGTHFSAGQGFTKQWTMRNSGTSTWTRGANFLWTFDGQEQFGAAEQTLLPEGVSVAPGETYAWQVAMNAPLSVGTHRGYWRMDNFGVGRFGDRVWVEIIVDDVDGGPPDAGPDAGTDAGTDAGSDPGSDPSSPDQDQPDGSSDAGPDSTPADHGPDNVSGCRCSSNPASSSLWFVIFSLIGLRLRKKGQ
jgi:Ig-like domain-containing protein/CHAP domain-containing protein